MPSRSMVVSILMIFAGYTIGSYAYVMIRGWNVSIRQWIDPLDPFQWPADGGNPLCVPPGQLFGNGIGGVKCGGSSSGPINARTPAAQREQAFTQHGVVPGAHG